MDNFKINYYVKFYSDVLNNFRYRPTVCRMMASMSGRLW